MVCKEIHPCHTVAISFPQKADRPLLLQIVIPTSLSVYRLCLNNFQKNSLQVKKSSSLNLFLAFFLKGQVPITCYYSFPIRIYHFPFLNVSPKNFFHFTNRFIPRELLYIFISILTDGS